MSQALPSEGDSPLTTTINAAGKTFDLMNLPAELRLNVYDAILADYDLRRPEDFPTLKPPVMLASQTIRNEILSLWLQYMQAFAGECQKKFEQQMEEDKISKYLLKRTYDRWQLHRMPTVAREIKRVEILMEALKETVEMED